MPTIIYAVIVDSKKEIKAEFPSGQGNLREIVVRIVNSGNFVRYPHKRSLQHKQNNQEVIFHYCQYGEEVAGGLAIFCVADNDMPYYICYNMMNELKMQIADKSKLNPTFMVDTRALKSLLSTTVKTFRKPGGKDGSDSFLRVLAKVGEVKTKMIDNIDMILNNNEKLDNIADKADELCETSTSFKKKASDLKNAVWLNNWFYVLVLLLIVAAVIGIGVWLGCGFPTLQRCRELVSQPSKDKGGSDPKA